MATGTAGQNASGLQTLANNQRNTAAVVANAPKNSPEGKVIVMTATGNASATAFTVAHGLGAVPTSFPLVPTTVAAAALHYFTADATNVTVTFLAAPPAAANNIGFVGWAFF